MAYECIRAEKKGRVGLIAFNRPKAMNALNPLLIGELAQALEAFEGVEQLRQPGQPLP